MSQDSKGKQKITPGPKGLPVVNHLFEYRKAPVSFLQKNTEEYGDIYTFSIAHYKVLMLMNPEYIRHVLHSNSKNYVKSKQYEQVKLLTGAGVFTSEKEEWTWRRNMAKQSFQHKTLKGYVRPMAESIVMIEKKWEKNKAEGKAFDLSEDMNMLALDVAGRTMFGRGFFEYALDTSRILSEVAVLIQDRVFSVPVPIWIPTPDNLRLKKYISQLKSMVTEIVDEGREKYKRGELKGNLLAHFFDHEEKAVKEHNWSICEEVLTYFLAGHETTGSTFTWVWYILAIYPEVSKRLRAELKKVLKGRAPEIDDLPKLPYLRSVIMETLRRYPPVWLLGRLALGEDDIDGHKVTKGMNIFISTYVSHHHPKYWNDPYKFDPDRFAPDKLDKINPYVFIPFGAGPRTCIGNDFAMQELMIGIGYLAQRFSPQLAPNFEPNVIWSIVMRLKDGMMMTL